MLHTSYQIRLAIIGDKPTFLTLRLFRGPIIFDSMAFDRDVSFKSRNLRVSKAGLPRSLPPLIVYKSLLAISALNGWRKPFFASSWAA